MSLKLLVHVNRYIGEININDYNMNNIYSNRTVTKTFMSHPVISLILSFN